MIHGNNLYAIRQFAIEQPVRKRINAAAANGRFKDRPPFGIPANIFAILHVPILPPVRVNLKPVWFQRTQLGAYRIGCAFVS